MLQTNLTQDLQANMNFKRNDLLVFPIVNWKLAVHGLHFTLSGKKSSLRYDFPFLLGFFANIVMFLDHKKINDNSKTLLEVRDRSICQLNELQDINRANAGTESDTDAEKDKVVLCRT